jgi:hypothetical protein
MNRRSRRAPAVLLVPLTLVAIAAAGPAAAGEELDRLAASDVPVMLNVPEATVDDVINMLAEAGAFEVSFANEPPGEMISLEVRDVTVREVLELLADDHGLRYEVPDPRELVVYFPDP